MSKHTLEQEEDIAKRVKTSDESIRDDIFETIEDMKQRLTVLETKVKKWKEDKDSPFFVSKQRIGESYTYTNETLTPQEVNKRVVEFYEYHHNLKPLPPLAISSAFGFLSNFRDKNKFTSAFMMLHEQPSIFTDRGLGIQVMPVIHIPDAPGSNTGRLL